MSLRGHHDDDSGIEQETPSTDTDCPECSGTLRTKEGETVCEACGLVVDEHRITRHERTYFNTDETDPRRTGAPLTQSRHDRGLSSEIGWKTDGQGNSLSGEKRRQLGRLRREHRRAKYQSKAERNLAKACTEIRRMVGALALPQSVREQACTIYRRAQEEDLIVGRSIETMASGSLYAACRCSGFPRTVDDVAHVARVPAPKVRLGYSICNRELNLPTDVTTPDSFIPQIASGCELPQDVERRAMDLDATARSHGIANGRNPRGVAAACLYLASEEDGVHCTQRELSDAATVSPVTLRQRYYELRAVIDETDS